MDSFNEIECINIDSDLKPALIHIYAILRNDFRSHYGFDLPRTERECETIFGSIGLAYIRIKREITNYANFNIIDFTRLIFIYIKWRTYGGTLVINKIRLIWDRNVRDAPIIITGYRGNSLIINIYGYDFLRVFGFDHEENLDGISQFVVNDHDLTVKTIEEIKKNSRHVV